MKLNFKIIKEINDLLDSFFYREFKTEENTEENNVSSLDPTPYKEDLILDYIYKEKQRQKLDLKTISPSIVETIPNDTLLSENTKLAPTKSSKSSTITKESNLIIQDYTQDISSSSYRYLILDLAKHLNTEILTYPYRCFFDKSIQKDSHLERFIIDIENKKLVYLYSLIIEHNPEKENISGLTSSDNKKLIRANVFEIVGDININKLEEFKKSVKYHLFNFNLDKERKNAFNKLKEILLEKEIAYKESLKLSSKTCHLIN